MKTLLKNAFVVNVFTDEVKKQNVLIENDRIIGVGDYDKGDANKVRDLAGKFICPGLIDGHIHIESSMMIPYELSRAVLPRGTTAIVADPHEIANVCGIDGIRYMMEASEGLPLDVYFTAPSCVPASMFDESGAVLRAADLKGLYESPRILGLAEMMNYPGTIAGDREVLQKIKDAKAAGRVVDGHAPLVTGRDLDAYAAAGVMSDHECSNMKEALEKLERGQFIMIREGSVAKNLKKLMPLFDPKYNHRCLLVTDDAHATDLLNKGHIDSIIRKAVDLGADPVVAIRMATLQAARYFRIPDVGAVAPGYIANLTIVDDLTAFHVTDVYSHGNLVVKKEELGDYPIPQVEMSLEKRVRSTFHVEPLTADDFVIHEENGFCRVIGIIPGEIITKELHEEIDFSKNSGIDVSRDILKIAVIERHNGTGHKGIGFIQGIGIKEGAVASSVSHDSHNIIVIGTNDADMAVAVNRVIQLGGGNVVVKDGKDIARMALPIAGLMSDFSAKDTAGFNARGRNAVYELGTSRDVEPFMNMAFLSLPVIPALKMSTQGLVDVLKFERVPLKV